MLSAKWGTDWELTDDNYRDVFKLVHEDSFNLTYMHRSKYIPTWSYISTPAQLVVDDIIDPLRTGIHITSNSFASHQWTAWIRHSVYSPVTYLGSGVHSNLLDTINEALLTYAESLLISPHELVQWMHETVALECIARHRK